MRTLIPDQAPIDLGTMNDDEAAGFASVQNSGCFFWHSASGNPTLLTPNGIFADAFDSPLSDGQPHFIGISNDARKAPTLRNVGLHRKFFSTGHGGDGLAQVFVTSLDELVSFYEAQAGILGFGGRLPPQERAQVLGFLCNALTDPRGARELPPFDRPTLYAETHPFGANEYGRGAASRGLRIPEIIANAPPHVVQPGERSWFKVGAGNAPPRAAATLAIGTSPAPGPVVWVGGHLTFLSTTTNGSGLATMQQPIPMATAVLGVPFYAQWFFVPVSGQASSNAAEFVPFRW